MTGVIYTDSVDRTPELSLRPRITWTEDQKSRCVHGFRGPNARTIVALTDSVDRTPELSLRPRISYGGTGGYHEYDKTFHWIIFFLA
jgi:hypothetical protein